MKEIPLTKGYVALVDDEDYERVMQHKWYAHKAKNTVYALTRIKDAQGKWRTRSLHTLLLPLPRGYDVDHWDGDGLHCYQSNLRQATRSQNMGNRRPNRNAYSQYKGVRLEKRNQYRKWRAVIKCDGKDVGLGSFVTEKEAALAYNAMAPIVFGEFARLNEVTDD